MPSICRTVLTTLWVLAASVGAIAATATTATKAEYSIDKAPPWIAAVSPDTAAPPSVHQQSGGVSYLLVDRQVQVKGKNQQNYTHLAIKILNESGLEGTSNIEIRFDPSYQTLALHTVTVRRGDKTTTRLKPAAIKILQRETSLEQLIFDGTKTANLFLEDVRVGDIVEYAYTLSGSNPVFGNRHYGRFDVQWSVPVQQIYIRLLTEPGKDPAIKLVNTQQAATSRMSNGFQENEWNLKDIAALRFRDDTPGWFDPVPSIQWSDFKDWNAVAQWGAPLYTPPTSLRGDLAAEVQRISAAYASPQERAVEALRFVQRSVRYLGVEVGPGSHAPNPPDLVMARRFGDCKDKTLLTLTLLKALDIEAQAALVNTRRRRGILDLQSSPGAFDHVIVHAKINDKVYWLDPTLPMQMGSIHDISQANFGQAMILQADQTSLTAIDEGPATNYSRKLIAVFDSSGGTQKPVTFTLTSITEGVSAEKLRNSIAKESQENMQQRLTNYYARYYSDIQLVRPFEVYDNKDSNQIVTTEYYVIPDFWKTTNEDRVEAFVAVPDIYDFLRIPQNTVRSEPLGKFHPMNVVQTTYVLVPEKWSLKGRSTKVKDAVFEFQSTAAYEPSRLTLTDSYRTLSDAIDAQHMSEYLANAKKARDGLGYSISMPVKSAN